MYDGSELTRPDQSQGSAPAATNTTPAPGAAFGGTSTTESKPPAFSFGGSTTPAAQPPANLFGSKPAATGSSGLFGQGNPGSQGATTTPTQAPATGGLFGAAKPAAATGFSFGKPAENAEAPKTGGFSFGKPAEAPKPSGFSFGKPAEKKDEPATEAKPAEAGNLFSKPPASTSGTQTDTKPTNVAVSAPSLLRGKSMEDIVKMWQGELDASIKEFSQQAGEVAAYDRVLLKGGDEISRLVAQIAQAEERQSGIDQTLDYVEQQQTELNALLDTYESQRSELLQASGAHGRMDMGVADVEREKAYALAENLNTQLDDMSRNLVSMIDEVNQMSAPTTNGRRAVRDATDASSEALGSLQVSRDVPGYEDPITQISAILNAHFSSLKWIDEHTSSLRDRLEALRRGQTDKAHAANDTLRLSVGPDAPRSSTPSRTLLDHRGSPATFRSSTSARYLGA